MMGGGLRDIPKALLSRGERAVPLLAAAASGLAATMAGAPPVAGAVAALGALGASLLAASRPRRDTPRTAAALNKAVFDSVADGIVGLDRNGHITFVNPAAEKLSGLDERDLIGLEGRLLFGLALRPSASAIAASRFEASLPRRGGDPVPVRISLSPIVERHKVTGQVAVLHDDRERRSAEENRRLAAAVLEWSMQAIIVADSKGRVVTINPAFSRLSGFDADEIVGQPVSVLRSDAHDALFHAAIRQGLEQDGSWKGEVWNRRKDGSAYAVWLSITRIQPELGGAGFFVAFYFDITERKQNEQRILEAANHDALTGLPNRRMFENRLAAAMDDATRRGTPLAVMLVDLDGFKAVNDTHGHDAGDAVLRQVARRMGETIRATDMVARLGGDEFILLLPAMSRRDAIARLAETLVEQVSRPVSFQGAELRVSASIGIAVLGPGDDPARLLASADRAMYEVKKAGKHGYRFATPVEAGFVRAEIDHGEMLCLYQPVIDLSDLSVRAVEARPWHRSAAGGMRMAGDGAGVRDDDGAIILAEAWCRTQALAAPWRQGGGTALRLGVPLHWDELADSQSLAAFLQGLAAWGWDGRAIDLLLPALSADADMGRLSEALAPWLRAGSRAVVDGDGGLALDPAPWSGLRMDVLRLPVAALLTAEGDGAMERARAAVAGMGGSHVLVAGVETPEQISRLVGGHGLLAMGGALGRPMPAAAVADFAASFNQSKGERA